MRFLFRVFIHCAESPCCDIVHSGNLSFKDKNWSTGITLNKAYRYVCFSIESLKINHLGALLRVTQSSIFDTCRNLSGIEKNQAVGHFTWQDQWAGTCKRQSIGPTPRVEPARAQRLIQRRRQNHKRPFRGSTDFFSLPHFERVEPQ